MNDKVFWWTYILATIVATLVTFLCFVFPKDKEITRLKLELATALEPKKELEETVFETSPTPKYYMSFNEQLINELWEIKALLKEGKHE